MYIYIYTYIIALPPKTLEDRGRGLLNLLEARSCALAIVPLNQYCSHQRKHDNQCFSIPKHLKVGLMDKCILYASYIMCFYYLYIDRWWMYVYYVQKNTQLDLPWCFTHASELFEIHEFLTTSQGSFLEEDPPCAVLTPELRPGLVGL